MIARLAFAAVFASGCAFSLTCEWVPVRGWAWASPGDACYRVEALADDARVTMGESCPGDADRCVVARVGQDITAYADQTTQREGALAHGYVPCDTTCADPWPEGFEPTIED